jgi:hypothetical protein
LELLLNLFWLLLALPAVWVWQQARCTQPGCRVHSRRSLLLIACVVLLLFPIISASDDLQAMRPEVEESTSRDALRHAQGCRHTASPDRIGIVSALPETPALFPTLQYAGNTAVLALKPRVSPSRSAHAGRAPPVPFFA